MYTRPHTYRAELAMYVDLLVICLSNASNTSTRTKLFKYRADSQCGGCLIFDMVGTPTGQHKLAHISRNWQWGWVSYILVMWAIPKDPCIHRAYQ